MCKVKLLIGSACGSSTFFDADQYPEPYPDLARHKKWTVGSDRIGTKTITIQSTGYTYLLPTFCRRWAGSRGASNARHWPWRPGLMSSPPPTDHVLPQYLWFWIGSFSETIMFCKFCCCCINSSLLPHMFDVRTTPSFRVLQQTPYAHRVKQ